MKHKIEQISNLAVILLCVVAIGSVALKSRSAPASPKPRFQPSGLFVGKMIDLPSLLGDVNAATVAVFLDSRCMACLASRDDYESLREAFRGSGNLRIVGVTTGNAKEVAERLDFRSPLVTVDDFGRYGVHGTPTVLLVDRSGVVRDFWVGKLSENTKRRLLRVTKESL